MNKVQILVLDFGSQYTQLIARRLREAGIYTEIVPYFEKLDSIKAKNPKGIILSGGPASVYEKDAYKPDSAIFALGIPILGICYGMQFIAYHFGGKVIKADEQEFGKAVLEILKPKLTLSFDVFNHQKFPQMIEALVDLWEDSVRASHLFLSEKDIIEIRAEVKKAFKNSQNIITAKNQEDFLGFIGVEKNQIEMLFVAPNAFKKGVGRALIKESFKRFLKDYPTIKVDCNEQNPQALGFYQHLGFEIIGKSPKDSAGRDFPIVHLEAQADNFAQSLQEKHLDYHIEVAQKQDLKAILALQHTAFADEAKRIGKMDIEPMTQDLQSIEKELKTQMILKCSLENGEIIGSVRGFTQEDTTYIRKLFVNPKYRKKGIASALIRTLCSKLAAKRYEIFTSEKSLENIALYEKLGFARFKCEKPKGFPIKAVFLEKCATQTQQTIFESKRTFVRELQQNDYQECCAILKELQANQAHQWVANIHKLQEWLDEQFNAYVKLGFGLWAVVDKKNHQFIGIAGFKNEGYQEILGFEKPLELQYFIKPKYWQQNYGKEVAQACMEYAFSCLQSKCVYAIIADDNAASKALAMRLDMQEVKLDSAQNLKNFAKSLELEIIDNPTKDFPILYVKQQITIFQTARCIVRPYMQADFDTLHSILSDKKTMHAWGHGFTKQESQEWLDKQIANYEKYGFGIWAIVEKQSGKIIGNMGLDYSTIYLDKSQQESQKIVEIGYILDHHFWGQGLASECAEACLNYAFETLELKEVYCLVKEDNFASQKVAQRINMQKVGECVKNYQGKELNHVVFKLEKNAWSNQKNDGIFAGVKQDSIVWMSHADKVESIPQGFVELAKSGNTHYCAIADFRRQIYALQFHPEVVHSECGGQILRNFAVNICGSDTSWNMHNFAANEIAKLRAIVGGESPKTFITFQESCKQMGEKQAMNRLLDIWEDSLKATQKMSKKLIAQRREEIKKDYILKAEHLIIAKSGEKWLGFIATRGNEITLLFVNPQYFGQKIGLSLLKTALTQYLQDFPQIVLNSRQWALEYYAKLGFKQIAKPFLAGNTGEIWLTPLGIESKVLQESLGICPPKLSRCEWATDKDEYARKLYEDYHDNEWGVPLHDDRKLFELLVLEAMQAGLSWITILKKREAFRVAFDDFDPKIVAKYDEAKIEELMQNEGIIRNRAKIEAAIHNAKLFLEIQKEFGSFDKYIWGFVGGKSIINTFSNIADLPASTHLSDTMSKDLKKRGFKFVGSTIMYAYMQSVGIVNDHLTSCFKKHSACSDSSLAQSLNECSDLARSFSPTKLPSPHLAQHSNLTQDTRIAKNDTNLEIENSKIVDKVCELQEKSQRSYLSGNDCRDFSPLSQNLPQAEFSHSKTTNKVLCAVSGGVDSSVVAALLYRAIGENLIPVFVDTGLLRKGEREAVEKMFRENLKVPLITADASALFLERLKGVIDPEKKRKIIGETFIEVFEKEAKKHNQNGEIKFLAQGTLYPDVIESVSVKGPSKTIKSHHNVGGLPEWMKFELIEPLRELFKDEVRALGRELGMPKSMLMRHPFPGPGLAIRIMGEVNKKDLDLLREADSIFIEELHKQGLYDKVWQAFCVLLNVRSVGVMGDNRTYDNTICVRAVEAIDGMTATFAHLPHDFLESVSNRIINEVEGINRVVFDITSKPPGTIEWE